MCGYVTVLPRLQRADLMTLERSKEYVMKVLAAVVLIGLLTGCASSGPTRPDGSAVSIQDAGSPPADAMAAVQPFLNRHLKDPYSAQVKILSGPTFITQSSSLLGPAVYGWGICFDVNARNSYGGYTGRQLMAIVWRDGSVIRHYDKIFAEKACQHIG
jgi:hypothetical protein